MDVDHPHARAAALAVDELVELHRHEVAALHRDHHGVATGKQILRRAVAEIPRVLHVGRNRVGASQLVPDVLGCDRRLDRKLLEALLHLRLEYFADVHLGNPDVAVRVALDFVEVRQVARIDAEHQPLGDDRDTVAPSVAQAFDDRSGASSRWLSL